MAENIRYSFKRYEKKYFITPFQQAVIMSRFEPYMKPDEFSKYTICSIYYDTDNWQLIRASLEKPAYKEKLRVRSYGTAGKDGNVFVEIKKKFSGVVYKRRVTTNINNAYPLLSGATPGSSFGQIGKEIEWFQRHYNTKPKIFIAYDRTAFTGKDNPELRITFDTNMRWRDTDLDLRLGDYGKPIISSDNILMEIKIPYACPVWLSRILSDTGAFPTSFSKYGTCYKNYILKADSKPSCKKEAYSCA